MTIGCLLMLLLSALVCATAASQSNPTNCELQKSLSPTSTDGVAVVDSQVICTSSGTKSDQPLSSPDKTEGSYSVHQSARPLFQGLKRDVQNDPFDRDVRSPGGGGGGGHQFMRFGRSHNFLRFGRDVKQHNFMRFGRSDKGMGHNFMRFGRPDKEMGHNFMRFGRPDKEMGHNFMRFGRSDKGVGHNFMRFGRPDKEMGHNFMRFGRADVGHNFMRFGRPDMGHNFMRFGRPDMSHNFMRFGRGSDEADAIGDSALYNDDDYNDDAVVESDQPEEGSLFPDLAALSAQEAIAGDGNDDVVTEDDNDDVTGSDDGSEAFQRVVKSLEHKFMRFGRANPAGHNFMRFGRIPEHTFMRFGRSGSPPSGPEHSDDDDDDDDVTEDHGEASALAPADVTSAADRQPSSTTKVKREGHTFMRFGRRRR